MGEYLQIDIILKKINIVRFWLSFKIIQFLFH